MMAGKRSWLKGCGLGCLVPVVVLIVLLAAVNLGGDQTIRTRRSVEERFGTAADFTPWRDGRIPADRLERYLAIRRALMADCETFSGAAERIAAMQELDRTPDEEKIDEGAAVGTVFGAMRAMVGVMAHLNAHLLRRNQLLLEHEMSLAEWSFLHVVVYYAWLEHEPRAFVLEDDRDQARVYQRRVRGEVVAMIARHVEDPLAAGQDPDHAAWFGELERLRRDPARIPFRGAVPPRLAASLEPFRTRLDSLWCAATDELDLSITEREGPGFEHI
jgi:hypothetical protein